MSLLPIFEFPFLRQEAVRRKMQTTMQELQKAQKILDFLKDLLTALFLFLFQDVWTAILVLPLQPPAFSFPRNQKEFPVRLQFLRFQRFLPQFRADGYRAYNRIFFQKAFLRAKTYHQQM